MSIEDTAERIIERLGELPRSERVRYLESVFDGLKKRTHERVANLEFAIGKLRNALIEYVPEPLKADLINLGTTAMIKMAADAFIVSDAALASPAERNMTKPWKCGECGHVNTAAICIFKRKKTRT